MQSARLKRAGIVRCLLEARDFSHVRLHLDVIYEVEEESEVVEDIEVIAEGFKLLQYDYLGGHGSRGYGKVKITDICANVVIGKLDDELVNRCNELLNEVISK